MPGTRRLAAILAADVAGYSLLIGGDEDGTLQQLKAIRAELIDPTISKHKAGSSIRRETACSSSSAVDALRCAIELKAGMGERNPRRGAGSTVLENLSARIKGGG